MTVGEGIPGEVARALAGMSPEGLRATARVALEAAVTVSGVPYSVISGLTPAQLEMRRDQADEAAWDEQERLW